MTSELAHQLRILLNQDWKNYEQAKTNSVLIDELLGFEIEKAESLVREGNCEGQDWRHLSWQSFQTPYSELAAIVQSFPEQRTLSWIDLGAAYGRLGIVLSLCRPQDQFLGLEFVSTRVEHGNEVFQRHQLGQSAKLECRDLRNKTHLLPEFDVAFLFDFGNPNEVSELLQILRERSTQKPVTLIGRGRATRHLIHLEHPWLCEVIPPVHTEHWSLYRSSEVSPGGLCS